MTLEDAVATLIRASVFGFTGFLIFLNLYNRALLHLKHGTFKSVVCYTAMAVLPLGFLSLALTQHSHSLLPGVTVLMAGFGVMELQTRLRRKRLRASPPCSEVYLEGQIHKRRLLNQTTEHLVVREYQPGDFAWNGPDLKIAHLSDLHIDKNPNTAFFERVFETLAQLKPDILLLTGDYTDNIHDLDRLTHLVGSVTVPLGIYAAMGNHDYWSQPARIRRSLESVGVVFPPVSGVDLHVCNNKRLTIHRIDYPYIKPWTFEKQVSTPEHRHLVLSHTPDNFFRLARLNADLIFSGHLHGGQWRLPLIGSVVAPSIRDRLIDHGYFRINNSHLFVTAGIGNVWMPLRINCPPEILLVDLKGHPVASVPDSEKVLSSQGLKAP